MAQFSISQIKNFKACRRSYFFRYVEELEPTQKAEALEIGSNYHELIAWLYEHGSLDGVEEDNSKELAMACAYMKYIYPKFKVKAVEESFEYPIGEHSLIGRVDGVADDGRLVEHKTTGSEITEQYEYNLMWDEQILAYMLAYGVNQMYYTVCRKPTIRQKQNETEEDFFNRMIEWYDTDTDKKIRLILIERTDEEIEQFRNHLFDMCNEISNTKNYYANCLWCNVWGRRCEYSSICLNYDPQQQYIEFQKVERRTKSESEEIG